MEVELKNERDGGGGDRRGGRVKSVNRPRQLCQSNVYRYGAQRYESKES